jgi:hypothetical protein
MLWFAVRANDAQAQQQAAFNLVSQRPSARPELGQISARQIIGDATPGHGPGSTQAPQASTKATPSHLRLAETADLIVAALTASSALGSNGNLFSDTDRIQNHEPALRPAHQEASLPDERPLALAGRLDESASPSPLAFALAWWWPGRCHAPA